MLHFIELATCTVLAISQASMLPPSSNRYSPNLVSNPRPSEREPAAVSVVLFFQVIHLINEVLGSIVYIFICRERCIALAIRRMQEELQFITIVTIDNILWKQIPDFNSRKLYGYLTELNLMSSFIFN